MKNKKLDFRIFFYAFHITFIKNKVERCIIVSEQMR